jgi:subtilase family serine protease
MSTLIPLHNSRATIPTDAVSVVPKDPTEIIRVTIFVRRPTWNGLTVEQYAGSVVAGVNPVLTRDEFKQKFRASDADLNTVAEFVRTEGITVLGQYNSSAAVELEGSVANFNTLFGTELQTVATEKTIYTCYEGDLSVDDSIDDIITLVDGLDQTLSAQSRSTMPYPAGTPVPKPGSTPFVTPQAIADVYNFPGSNDGNDGTGQVVAIILPFGLSSGAGGSGCGYDSRNLTSTFTNTLLHW